MKYNALGKTGLLVSEVGLGCEFLQGKSEAVVRAVLDAVLAKGVNIIDVFMSEPEVRTNIGKALAGRRDQVYIQGHLCAVWKNGQYGRSRDPEEVRFFFEDLLTRLQTDYIDLGMIHFIDSEEEYRAIFETGLIDQILELKKQGKIRHLGFSSHDPQVALKVVRTGLVEAMLFSINAAYDLLPPEVKLPCKLDADSFTRDGTAAFNPARAALYDACAAAGVGITVMKTLGAGRLLSADSSPFGVALSVPQCIQYVLSRPAVASAMVGMQTVEEVEQALAFEDATEEERDFSGIFAAASQFTMAGKCMYCNHCLPCPQGLDIAAIHKYLDLATAAEAVPDTVRAHYEALDRHAGDCIGCRGCESRCPFDVKTVEAMAEAKALFGY